MLSLTVKYGDSVQISEHTTIRVEHKRGRNVRLVIDSPLTPIKIIHNPDRDNQSGLSN